MHVGTCHRVTRKGMRRTVVNFNSIPPEAYTLLPFTSRIYLRPFNMPAVTRRQSGKLPPPIYDTKAASDTDASDGNDYFSELDGHTRRKQPKTTRARVAKSAKQGTRRKGGVLSILPTLPLDVLFEIFCHLDPTSLLNLARTNRAFRNTLMTRKAITVWKIVLKNNSNGAPACPPDVSEPRWANLLFGGTKCQECGTTCVQKIDFALRRRICTPCLKKNLVYSANFTKQFPDFDPAILDLIPHTNIGAWSHGHASSSQFYWEADIYDMVPVFGQYRKDVYMHEPGAKDALEKFRKSRVWFVEEVVKHARVCNEWSEKVTASRRCDAEARKRARYFAIVQRFKDSGYKQTDISWIRYLPQVNVDRELTDRIWARIRPELEPEIQRRNQERLDRERAALIRGRKAVVQQVYDDYKKTLVPMQWIFLPRPEEVYLMQEFDELINAPTSDALNAGDCSHALHALPGYLASRADRLRQEMLELLPPKEEHEEVNVPETDDLSLARSVFTCTSPHCITDRILVACSGVMSHDCSAGLSEYNQFYAMYHPEYKGLQFAFSERRSAAVSSLVCTLNRDPDQMTAQELDALDPRFVCLNCTITRVRGGIQGRLAMSWRQCLSHLDEFEDDTAHALPKWQVVEEDKTELLKCKEGSEPVHTSQQWSCNHCPVHLHDLRKRAAIIKHVKQVHAEARPQEDRDFFHAKPSGRKRSEPFGLAMGPQMERPHDNRVKEWTCNQCIGVNRLFYLLGVTDHLRDKHHKHAPVEGVDYMRMKLTW